MEPIWSNIPYHFKKDVFESLSYIDRIRLRHCSHSEKSIVDKCCVKLSQVAIKVSRNYSTFQFSETGETVISMKVWPIPDTNRFQVETKECPMVYKPGKIQKTLWKRSAEFTGDPHTAHVDFTVQSFINAVKNLKCDRIIINDVILVTEFQPVATEEDLDILRKALFPELLSSCKNKFKIKASTIRLCLKPTDSIELMHIFDVFDAKILKRIELADRNNTWELKEVAKESEVWKSAKEIHLELHSDLELEHFQHAEKVQMFVLGLEPTKVWAVIKKFISKNQHGSSFHFSFKRSYPDVQGILNTFPVHPSNQPIQPKTQLRTALNSRFVHTQRFEMPSRNLVLLVMISETEVMGTVCLAEKVDDEASIEMGIMR